jgi:hypothetical protein
MTDVDGDLLHLDMVTAVTGGRMELSDGVYTFIPDQDFYGEASFTYLASNNQGEEVHGQLFLGVSPVNDLPNASYQATTGIEDHETTLMVSTLIAGASDVEDGAELRFGGIDSSLHGDVYVDPQGMIHFLPDQDFSGGAFFSYQVLDSEGGVGYGYVGVEVIGENDPPVAMDDAKILAWSNNSYENIYMSDIFLNNDVDVDHDPLQIISVNSAEFGNVSVDSMGNIHYLAKADGWVGIDTFNYTISDGNGGFSTAEAAIDVKINTSPDIFSELLFTREDIISHLVQQDLLANDMDIDGDTLRVIAVDQAEHCQVELLADGSIRYVPELNYNDNCPEKASFRYTVTDGISDPVAAIAFFDIDPVNDAPILCGEHIAGAVEDNSFAFAMTHLLANDSDVEMASPYEEDAISFAGAWGAGHGSITYDHNTETVFYVPRANFNGVDTFSYKVVDLYGAESVVQSFITVQSVNDFPVVQDDIGEAEDSVWNYYSIGNLVGNDFDVDGDALTILNPRVLGGRADVRLSGGDLMVKPDYGENRVVVGYSVSDGHGGEVNGQLSIDRIREHNFAPTFSGIYAIGWKNSYTVWFNFHAEDKNGGNTWGESGDIVSISASAPNVGQITDEGYTFKYKGDTENASVILTAVDQAGATGSIYVRISDLSTVDGQYIYSPVVLDLDGDGVELLNVSAGVGFDWDLDGNPNATGWVGGDDGFLVYDYDRNRIVTKADELVLKDYNPGATTDLEGLRAFDSNNNGVFDAADEEWAAFGVWQDKNSNGQTDNDGQEFATLDERGIAAINLESDNNFQEVEGNVIHGMTAYQRVDGTVGAVGDVGLLGQSLAMVEVSVEEAGVLAGDTRTTDEKGGGSLENHQDVAGDSAVTGALPEDFGKVDAGDDSLASVASAADQGTEIEAELYYDDAEINRLSNQLLSDIAASSGDETTPGVAHPDVSEYHGDLPDPLTLPDHEYLMIA